MGNSQSCFRAAERGDVARILALASHDNKVLHAHDEVGARSQP